VLAALELSKGLRAAGRWGRAECSISCPLISLDCLTFASGGRFRAGEFSSPIRFVNRQALFFSPAGRSFRSLLTRWASARAVPVVSAASPSALQGRKIRAVLSDRQASGPTCRLSDVLARRKPMSVLGIKNRVGFCAPREICPGCAETTSIPAFEPGHPTQAQGPFPPDLSVPSARRSSTPAAPRTTSRTTACWTSSESGMSLSLRQ
jgi:hypothetical protein